MGTTCFAASSSWAYSSAEARPKGDSVLRIAAEAPTADASSTSTSTTSAATSERRRADEPVRVLALASRAVTRASSTLRWAAVIGAPRVAPRRASRSSVVIEHLPQPRETAADLLVRGGFGPPDGLGDLMDRQVGRESEGDRVALRLR